MSKIFTPNPLQKNKAPVNTEALSTHCDLCDTHSNDLAVDTRVFFEIFEIG